MVFKVTIPNNSWFSIGFGGKTMKNVDMIAWFADKGAGSAKDYWSIGEFAPAEDTKQNISQDSAPVFDEVANTVSFVTRRKLDTGDTK